MARYWPEFAANGKEKLQLKYVLDHRAGMALVSEPIARGSVYDHAVMAAALARQPAAWEPGTDAGYHVLTQGFIMAEVVRRVTGKTLGNFFRSEIAEPLNIDFGGGTTGIEHLQKRRPPVVQSPEAQKEQVEERRSRSQIQRTGGGLTRLPTPRGTNRPCQSPEAPRHDGHEDEIEDGEGRRRHPYLGHGPSLRDVFTAPVRRLPLPPSEHPRGMERQMALHLSHALRRGVPGEGTFAARRSIAVSLWSEDQS